MFSAIECTGFTSWKFKIRKKRVFLRHILTDKFHLLNEASQAWKINVFSIFTIEKEHGLWYVQQNPDASRLQNYFFTMPNSWSIASEGLCFIEYTSSLLWHWISLNLIGMTMTRAHVFSNQMHWLHFLKVFLTKK
jgi:hypothetical protein